MIYYTTDDLEIHQVCLNTMSKIKKAGHFYTAFDVTKCQKDFIKSMIKEDSLVKQFPFVYTDERMNSGKPVQLFELDALLNVTSFHGTNDKPVHLIVSQMISDQTN